MHPCVCVYVHLCGCVCAWVCMCEWRYGGSSLAASNPKCVCVRVCVYVSDFLLFAAFLQIFFDGYDNIEPNPALIGLPVLHNVGEGAGACRGRR